MIKPCLPFSFQINPWFSFTIAISEVIELDSQNNLVFKALADILWYDPRFQWSLIFPVPQWKWPQSVVRDVSRVWYPVFEILDCPLADCTIFPPNKSHIYQQFDGFMELTLFQLISSKCPLDYTFFPFDHQTCNFSIVLLDFDLYHASNTDFYNLTIGSISAFIGQQSPELNLLSYSIELVGLEYAVTNGSSQSQTAESTIILENKSVFVNVTLSRVGSYFVYNLIVPLYVIVALGISTIFMPAAESEKPGLHIQALVAFTLYQLLLANNTPQTASVPLIGY